MSCKSGIRGIKSLKKDFEQQSLKKDDEEKLIKNFLVSHLKIR